MSSISAMEVISFSLRRMIQGFLYAIEKAGFGPLCFGYENRTLYFHTGMKGKKVDVLEKNPNVCFEFDVDCKAVRQPEACDWAMAYRSVIGYGKASFVTSPERKRKALDVIMRQYGGDAGPYPDAKIKVTRIIQVEISRMRGKRSPAPES